VLAASRTPARGRSDDRARRPRRAITGRAIVLATLVVLLLVVLASPLNRYFASRGALDDAAQKYQQDQQALHQVRKELARWSDPGYIQRQARVRLQYAMPGDTVYVVVGSGQKNDIARTAGTGRASSGSGSWNVKLWDSVTSADAGK
jgi:cell division protein FtsB